MYWGRLKFPKKRRRAFSITLLINALALLALVGAILLSNYYEKEGTVSNVLIEVFGSIVIISTFATFWVAFNYHSHFERALIIILMIFILAAIVFIALDGLNPLYGVIGTSIVYFAAGDSWLLAMYFYGFIGTKYKSGKKISASKTKKK